MCAGKVACRGRSMQYCTCLSWVDLKCTFRLFGVLLSPQFLFLEFAFLMHLDFSGPPTLCHIFRDCSTYTCDVDCNPVKPPLLIHLFPLTSLTALFLPFALPFSDIFHPSLLTLFRFLLPLLTFSRFSNGMQKVFVPEM